MGRGEHASGDHLTDSWNIAGRLGEVMGMGRQFSKENEEGKMEGRLQVITTWYMSECGSEGGREVNVLGL